MTLNPLVMNKMRACLFTLAFGLSAVCASAQAPLGELPPGWSLMHDKVTEYVHLDHREKVGALPGWWTETELGTVPADGWSFVWTKAHDTENGHESLASTDGCGYLWEVWRYKPDPADPKTGEVEATFHLEDLPGGYVDLRDGPSAGAVGYKARFHHDIGAGRSEKVEVYRSWSTQSVRFGNATWQGVTLFGLTDQGEVKHPVPVAGQRNDFAMNCQDIYEYEQCAYSETWANGWSMDLPAIANLAEAEAMILGKASVSDTRRTCPE